MADFFATPYTVREGASPYTGYPIASGSTTLGAGEYSEAIPAQTGDLTAHITFTTAATGTVETQRSLTLAFTVHEVVSSDAIPASGLMLTVYVPAGGFVRFFNNTNQDATVKVQIDID